MSNKFITTTAAGVLALGLGALLAQAAAPATPQGFITEKVFLNLNTGQATSISSLTSSPKFPNNPDIVAYPTYFELWATGDPATPPSGTSGYVDYGAQMLGYFYPNTTGDYDFYICSDDLSDLYLSTDDTPANKKLIAQETVYSNVRQYGVSAGNSDVTAKVSNTFTGTQWPVKDLINGGARITLTAGKAYYIEALQKQGGGGDNLSVSINMMVPIPGSYLSTIDLTLGPVSITTQPQSVSVTEGQPATFSVVANGTPPYTYQWEKNGTAVANATNTSYAISRAYRADNGGKFDVVVTGAQGTVTSSTATLTVANDTTPPTVVSASSSPAFNAVVLTFSEPLDPASAANTANYTIDNGVTVTAAALGATPGTPGDNVVVLTTSTQPQNTLFTLTVSNVKDVPGNVMAPNTKVQFRSYAWAANTILHKVYYNCSPDGFSLANLFADPRYPNNPDARDLVSTWEWPPNNAGTIAADPNKSMYYDSLEGYFVPPTTGDYVFYMSGDDEFYMYLSTDESPANMKEIAAEPGGWSTARYWNTDISGTVANWNSATYANTAWPNGNTITLTAGNKYYLILFHHDHSWSGGDWFGATYSGGAVAVPADGDVSKLTGSLVGFYLDPTGASINFVQQPADTTGVDGWPVTLLANATGTSLYGTTVSYQWQTAPKGSTNFTDIPGATLNSLNLPIVSTNDSGTQYRVIASVVPISVPSSVATVTVVPDIWPPVVQGATAFSNATSIGVMFNKAVDPTTAGTAANYKVNGAAVTSVYVRTNVSNEKTSEKNLVQLSVSTPVAADFQLTISGVKDLHGNVMAITNLTGNILKLGITDIGSAAGQPGGPDPLAPSTVTTWGTGAFDVLCNGNDYYYNADGFNFIWEPKTNSFDVKVRVVSISAIDNWSAAAIEVREGPPTPNGGGWELARHYFAKTDYGGEGVQTLHGTGVGADAYEFNGRVAKGDPTLRETSNNAPGGSVGTWNFGTGPGNPGAPAYPNAWIRIQRVNPNPTNDQLIAYTSSDGIIWSQRMAVDLNDTNHAGFLGVDGQPAGPWPSVCYVGLGSTSHTGVGNPPQTNDGTYGDGSYWFSPVGQPYMCYVIYRDWGDYVAPSTTTPALALARNADGTLTLTYTGNLYSAQNVAGPYTIVTGATSPYNINPKTAGKSAQFFRAGP